MIRNAGNIVPSFGPEPGGVTASVEYAVAALGVEDIVICGHSDCGAMTAIATCQCLEHLPTVAGWLRYADSAKAVNQAYPHASDEARSRRWCAKTSSPSSTTSKRTLPSPWRWIRPPDAARLGL